MRASILEMGSVVFSTLGILAIAVVLLSVSGTVTADEPLTGGNGCQCGGDFWCYELNGSCYGDDCNEYCNCGPPDGSCVAD